MSDERLALLREICAPYPNVEIDSFDGLLIEYGRNKGARVIVRGLRAATDSRADYILLTSFNEWPETLHRSRHRNRRTSERESP